MTSMISNLLPGRRSEVSRQNLSLRSRMAAIAMALVVALPSAAVAGSVPGWGSSYSGGKSQAKSANKPLIVLIAREGCPACEAMESELSTQASARALRSAVKVRVEATQNPDLTARYAAAGTPTTLVFTSDDNYSSPVYSYTGTMSAGTIKQVGRSLDSLASAATTSTNSKTR